MNFLCKDCKNSIDIVPGELSRCRYCGSRSLIETFKKNSDQFGYTCEECGAFHELLSDGSICCQYCGGRAMRKNRNSQIVSYDAR